MTLILGDVEEAATLRALLAVAIDKLNGELDVSDDDLVGRSASPQILTRRGDGRTKFWVAGTD